MGRKQKSSGSTPSTASSPQALSGSFSSPASENSPLTFSIGSRSVESFNGGGTIAAACEKLTTPRYVKSVVSVGCRKGRLKVTRGQADLLAEAAARASGQEAPPPAPSPSSSR